LAQGQENRSTFHVTGGRSLVVGQKRTGVRRLPSPPEGRFTLGAA
jgi:hypothetical protein